MDSCNDIVTGLVISLIESDADLEFPLSPKHVVFVRYFIYLLIQEMEEQQGFKCLPKDKGCRGQCY